MKTRTAWLLSFSSTLAAATLVASDPQIGWWPPFVPNVPIPEVQPAPPPAGTEELIVEGAECAGISGFRADWDRPIPLAADGAMTLREDYMKNFGAGPAADWRDPVRPGAIACDAVHRSLLVRFPGAAERIAAVLGQGKTIVRAELVLPYIGHEIFPPQTYANPPNMVSVCQKWAQKEPRWHAVAWALKRPWMADRELGPTYNAYINGAGYWAGFGAREAGADHVSTAFGPAPIHKKAPAGGLDTTPSLGDPAFGEDLGVHLLGPESVHKEIPVGRLDITASLIDPAFGENPGARLRRLADCGFLVRKWEAYDASFWEGGYEWSTGTGPRALLLGRPRLVLYLKQDGAAQAPALPPAADVRAMARELAGGKGGKPTAVYPSEAEIEGWIARFGPSKPEWMDSDAWQRAQQLWETDSPVMGQSPAAHGFPTNVAAYGQWLDALLTKAPRHWNHFDAAELGVIPFRYRGALPAPVLENLRLYWWAWLMPDREYSDLVQGYIGQAGFYEYYARTRDWRGNFSIYRTYCRQMGTMNFNHWASAGALFGGALLESPRVLAEGRHGLVEWPFKTWCWFDGSTQESIDHYYFTHTLASQKVFADFGPTVEDRLVGQAILAKTVGEIVSCLHPRLKRFTSSSGRTGIAYTLAVQDGLNHILHTLMPEGALTDFGRQTVGDGGVPAVGNDFPPGMVATLTLDGPWAPDWYGPAFAAKPIPYQMTANFKVWGNFGETPLWRRSFQARHYGVASLDLTQTVNPDTVPFLVHWHREDKPVETAEQLGVLIGRFGLNYTELLDTFRHESDAAGVVLRKKFNPNGYVGVQGGPTYSFQHRNRLIVLGSPAKGLPYERLAPAEVTSLQTTLGLLTLGTPSLELLVDGKPASAPLTLKSGQRIVIRDGVALVGIIPLSGTDLGRANEVEITVGGWPTEMQGHGMHASHQGIMAETLRINAYIYQGAPLPKDQWSGDRVTDAWSGFCIQAADTSEFKDAAAFDAHLATGRIDSAWDAAKRQVSLSWMLGSDTMACVFSPSAPIAQPTTNVFPSRTVNGKWPYLAPGLDRECDLSAMGDNGRLEKNGSVFEGKPGRKGSLLTDPVHGIYEAWNPYPEATPLALTLPGGARVETLGRVGITRVTAYLKENRVTLDGAVPADGRATVAALCGFAPGLKVQLNGQAATAATGQLDGAPVMFVALDGQPLPEAATLVGRLQELRAASANPGQ